MPDFYTSSKPQRTVVLADKNIFLCLQKMLFKPLHFFQCRKFFWVPNRIIFTPEPLFKMINQFSFITIVLIILLQARVSVRSSNLPSANKKTLKKKSQIMTDLIYNK